MRPSEALSLHRALVLALAYQHRAVNVRVFGSVLAGTDTERSDLDLLVDAQSGATLFDLGELQLRLEALLGVPVHVVTPGDLPDQIRDHIQATARPL